MLRFVQSTLLLTCEITQTQGLSSTFESPYVIQSDKALIKKGNTFLVHSYLGGR
jgi:hypothetical protein